MKKLFGLMALAFVLSGCGAKDPIKTERSTNSEILVDLLFEHDGCKMYRFEDGGVYVYYTKCSGGSSQTAWNTSSGDGEANSVIHHQVPTTTVP